MGDARAPSRSGSSTPGSEWAAGHLSSGCRHRTSRWRHATPTAANQHRTRSGARPAGRAAPGTAAHALRRGVLRGAGFLAPARGNHRPGCARGSGPTDRAHVPVPGGSRGGRIVLAGIGRCTFSQRGPAVPVGTSRHHHRAGQHRATDGTRSPGAPRSDLPCRGGQHDLAGSARQWAAASSPATPATRCSAGTAPVCCAPWCSAAWRAETMRSEAARPLGWDRSVWPVPPRTATASW